MPTKPSDSGQNRTIQRAHHRWERAFLASLALTGNVTVAAQSARIDRQRAYELREVAPDFAELWNQAIEASADLLEEEARRRAYDGWDEPVYQKGMQVGTVRKYSDTLLILLLKGNKPKKYRDNVDVTSAGKELAAFTLDGLSNEDRRAIIESAHTRLLEPGENVS